MKKKILILIAIIGAILLSCSENPDNKDKKNTVAFDLDSIMARGKLVAVTDFNSTNYFLYRGEPMGFHYELLKAFSDHLGVDIEIVTENSIENAFSMLKTGQVDLLAMGLTVSPSRKDEIRFTEPIDSTRQVLVQRKPHKWQTMSSSSLESKLIRKYTDLANKIIYVQKGSSHAELLDQLSKEIGQPITVVEVPFEAEALIQLVDKGEINYAVCDENIASGQCHIFPGNRCCDTIKLSAEPRLGNKKNQFGTT